MHCSTMRFGRSTSFSLFLAFLLWLTFKSSRAFKSLAIVHRSSERWTRIRRRPYSSFLVEKYPFHCRSPFAPSSCPSTALFLSKKLDDDDDDNPLLITIIDNISSVLSKPTPGFSDLALGYPLTLLLVAILVPPLQAVLTVILFAGFAFLSRQLTATDAEDDNPIEAVQANGNEEEEQESSSGSMDLFALGAAVGAARLLVPEDTSNFSFDSVVAIGGLLLTGAILFWGLQDLNKDGPTVDQKLMYWWDQRLDREERDKKNKK